MRNLIGEFECNLDGKGRLMFPAGLRKQLGPDENRFVINRSIFESCLVLYPWDEWEDITRQLNKLNRFDRKNDRFIRKFRNGANEVELDGSGRILIPKRLKEFAGLQKELVLLASANKIELWDKSKYDEVMDEDQEDFAQLAEEVMAGIDDPEKDGKEARDDD
jgi:MraZ protein